MDGRFDERMAWVTGAASGLGRAVALGLAREGARLLLFDRDARGLELVAAACPGAVAVAGDAGSAADVVRAMDIGVSRFGIVDLLATAAGRLGPAVPAADVDEADWDSLFAVNVKGTWLAIRAALPGMRRAGRGAIVTFASAAGLRGSATMPAYSATKGAVVTLTRSLAAAHAAEGIRANAVCPGSIDTPMLAETFATAGDAAARAAREAAFLARHPINGFGQPGEVAAAVLFLLSDAAAFVTGVALPVDGGSLA